jgi:hypothetical protein
MLLEAVERHVRVEQRILVVEARHEAKRELPVGQGVDEPAAEFLVPQRVSERVGHRPRLDPSARDFPELLQAERELLRLATVRERQPAQQLLRQIAPDTVAQDRDPGHDVDTRLEVRLVLAMFSDAAVAGADTDHARALDQDVLRREAREKVDAFSLDLSRQPARERVERDDVVAVIL